MFLEQNEIFVVDQKSTTVGKDVPFERTRRITGYLVGNESRWGNAKKQELKDRIKHSFETQYGAQKNIQTK